MKRMKQTLDLLLGKRLALFAVADVVVVLWTAGTSPRRCTGRWSSSRC